MVKNIVKYVLAILFSIGIYIAGLYSGTYIFSAMKSTSYLQDSFMMYTEVEDALHYLDEGDTNTARARLKMKSDIAVMQIDGFSEHADEKSVVTACKVLKSIANHRASHPNLYAEQSETDAYVSKILAKWKDREC